MKITKSQLKQIIKEELSKKEKTMIKNRHKDYVEDHKKQKATVPMDRHDDDQKLTMKSFIHYLMTTLPANVADKLGSMHDKDLKKYLKQIIKEELTNERRFLTTTPRDEDVSAALEDFVHVAVRRLTSNEELEYDISLKLTKAVEQAYEDIKRKEGFIA